MGDSHRRPLKPTTATPALNGDANVSIDVDGLPCYRAIHGLAAVSSDAEADPLWTIGIRRAAALLAEFGLKATFFVIGRDLEHTPHREATISLADADHEVANHTYDHPYDLRHLPQVELVHQLEACNRIITDVTGRRPVGFRTPGYNVSSDIIAFSRRTGHRYDASIFPCVSYWAAKEMVMQWRNVTGESSQSARTDPRALMAHRQPYFPDPLDCWNPALGPTSFVEIPIAVFAARTMPIIGTSLHLIDALGWERLWPFIDRSFDRFFNLEMHAIDFVDATDIDDVPDGDELVARQPDLRIPWSRKKSLYRRVFTSLARYRTVATLAEATAFLKAPPSTE